MTKELSNLLLEMEKSITFEKKHEDYNEDYKSWGMQYGILLSPREAQMIIDALTKE